MTHLTNFSALVFALTTISVFFGSPLHAIEGIECDDQRGICVATDSGVPLRVLTKPSTRLFSEANDAGLIIESNIPALQSYFVTEMKEVKFDRNTMESSGWYGVTPSLGISPVGYIKAEDVVPWRQALAVAFTNPGASQRKPVIMFDSLVALEAALAEIDGKQLTGEDLHNSINAGDQTNGIITRERNAWVDIDEAFYLMPIIEHDDVSGYAPGQDMRALRVTVLTGQSGAAQSKACDVNSTDFSNCQQKQSSGTTSGALAIDVVFVVDMTASMGPYINAVQQSIRQTARKIGEDSGSDGIRFGMVGYRDSVEQNPGLEWTTRNFSPELLNSAEFDTLLSSDKAIAASSSGSGDSAEEVFAGMKVATESAWREKGKAARMIILIGDASGHAATHEKNTTGLDEKSIADLTAAESVYTAAIYVGKNSTDLAAARPQFEAMAAGEGGAKAFSVVTDANAEQGLEGSLKSTIERMLETVKTGNFNAIRSEEDATSTGGTANTGDAILAAARAAFVDYVGDGASPPPSVTAWAIDRDIAAFDKQSMKVKVLVSRTDIENLIDFLDGLLSQFESQQTSGSSFFGTAQQGSVQASYDLKMDETQALKDSGAMPAAIASLPYKSDILTLTLEEFKNSSVDERTRIEERLKTLVKYYQASLSNTDAWKDLNQSGSVQDRVFLMDLSQLP